MVSTLGCIKLKYEKLQKITQTLLNVRRPSSIGSPFVGQHHVWNGITSSLSCRWYCIF